jgi:DNA-binding transcriptional MerR regulator/quercetin dioxygenase-like cupin family protein
LAATQRGAASKSVRTAPTIADGIAIKRPGGATVPLISSLVDDIVTVTDDAIAEAMVLLLERSKLVVEGAGAAALAALLTGAARPAAEGTTAVVLSGGNVDAALLSRLAAWQETRHGRRLRLFARVSDRPGALAALLASVSAARANVLAVDHVRDGVPLAVEETGIELTLATRGARAEAVIAQLRSDGHDVGPSGCLALKTVALGRSVQVGDGDRLVCVVPRRRRSLTASDGEEAAVGPKSGNGIHEPPVDASNPSGLYIRQVSQLVGVSPSVIRSWEAHRLVAPSRSDSGYRLYTAADVDRLRRIRDLIYKERLNIAGARLALDATDTPAPGPRNDGRDDAEERISVGARLRRLRQEQRLSLREVSERSGLSPSSISSLERSLSRPSVASLQKLAAALGTNLPRLMGRAADDDSLVVTAADRTTLELEIPGVVIEELSQVHTELEPLLFRVLPGSGSPSYHHQGSEFLYMLQGSLEVTLDESTTYLLQPEDALTFQSHRPHRWRNPGDVEALVLWVNTPPTF